ncbi:tyrosine-type recombinase/integrase [Microbacterium hydrocarbonoxydans]|uniref:tyrosine-type recombinase/integrase n=1 Tax=Microbacterium hydrocarbonoxydans TaxID=273678 RepID=UPI003D999C44
MTSTPQPDGAVTRVQKAYSDYAERGDGGLSQVKVKGKLVWRAKRYVGLVQALDAEGNPVKRPKYITGQGETVTAAKKNLRKNMDRFYELAAEERLLPRELRELTLNAYYRENWLPAAMSSDRYKTADGLDATRRRMEIHVLPALGSKPLREITPADIKTLVEITLPRKNLGAHMVTGIRKTLSAVLEDALTEGKLVAHPMARIKWRGAKPQQRRVEAPAGLVSAFRAEVAGTQEEARWMVSFELALRPGEALGLCWSAITGVLDDEKPYLRVKRQLKWKPATHAPTCQRLADGKKWTCGKSSAKCTLWPEGSDADAGKGRIYLEETTKSSRVRVIPLAEPLITLLREQRARQDEWREANPEAWARHATERPDLADLVFTMPNGAPRRQQTDSTALADILAKLRAKGINAEFSPHGARHIAITRMALAGVDEPLVRRIVGHMDQATTEMYQHIKAEDSRDALTALGEESVRSYRAMEAARADDAREAKRQEAEDAKKRAESAYAAWKTDRTGADGVVRFDPRTDPHPPLPLWQATWMPEEVAAALGQPGVKPEALHLFTGDLTMEEVTRFAPFGATDPAEVRQLIEDDTPDDFARVMFG